MSFKLSNGSELFSRQDLDRLRTASSGRMGSRLWVRATASAHNTVSAQEQNSSQEGDYASSETCIHSIRVTSLS